MCYECFCSNAENTIISLSLSLSNKHVSIISFIYLMMYFRSLYLDVAININHPFAYIGDGGIRIRCEAIGTKIRKPEWMTILLEGHFYERPLVNMVRTPSNSHTFEWGDEFNVTDLQQRMTVNGSLEGLVFLELDIYSAKIEDGGRYTCNYGGLDVNNHMLEFHESGDFFVQCR